MKTTQEPMNASAVFCPNPECCARGRVGEGNSVIHERQRPRYRCKTCGKSVSARQGTMFFGLRKPIRLVVIVVTLLAYGCPVQAIVQAFDLDERTIGAWRDRAGRQCRNVQKEIIEQGKLDLIHVQADEIRVKGRSQVIWMGLAARAIPRSSAGPPARTRWCARWARPTIGWATPSRS